MQATGLWNAYKRASATRPLQTKAATCAVGFAVGDIVAQLMTGKGSLSKRLRQLDKWRTLRTSAFGVFVAAPQLHVFYSFLDRTVYPHAPTSAPAIVAKVAADQLFNSPLGTTLFFAWNNALLGKSVEQTITDIKTKLWPTTKAGWSLWPAAQAINFLLVPSDLRVAYINLVNVVWTSILSRMAAKSGPEASVEPDLAGSKLVSHRV